MGMGLYLARLIAKAHGSDIVYKAMPDDADEGYNEFSFLIEIA
jgi:signal transduction histidine kinase